MYVQYRAIYELISRYHVPKSINSIITDCSSGYNESLEKALELEDYRYLMVMKEYRDEYSEKYCVFWDSRNNWATLLVRDQDLTVAGVAKLAFDYQQTIPKKEFVDLVASIADRDGFEVIDELRLFEVAYSATAGDYSLVYDKIQRNEPCPCGSGKKYKQCHGK